MCDDFWMLSADADASLPQKGYRRMVTPQPIARFGRRGCTPPEHAMLAEMDDETVFLMGDRPDLPVFPEAPKLLDFFRLRFSDIAVRHLLQSAKLALSAGQDETIVMACLLHDIANAALIRTDHGYWGAQLIEPYVSEEIAWAVRYHQALRYFPDESVGFSYPEAYLRYFGEGYEPPAYIKAAHEEARNHRWYMSSRMVTVYDVYSFQDGWTVDPEEFTDIIGRHFKQPTQGLGFDNSRSAHMWRTMIWPNNFL